MVDRFFVPIAFRGAFRFCVGGVERRDELGVHIRPFCFGHRAEDQGVFADDIEHHEHGVALVVGPRADEYRCGVVAGVRDALGARAPCPRALDVHQPQTVADLDGVFFARDMASLDDERHLFELEGGTAFVVSREDLQILVSVLHPGEEKSFIVEMQTVRFFCGVVTLVVGVQELEHPVHSDFRGDFRGIEHADHDDTNALAADVGFEHGTGDETGQTQKRMHGHAPCLRD